MRIAPVLMTALALQIAAAATGLAAEPAALAVTPLGSNGICKVTTVAKTDDAGDRLPRSEWYASAWRCPGHAGRFVHLAYGDQREGLAIGTRRKPASYLWHPGFGAWGPSMEWRGARGRPVAVIARYAWSIIEGDTPAPNGTGADLAVIRIGKDPAGTCIVAWIDERANPDAMALARRQADTAATNACPAAPARLGKLSPGRAP